MNRILVTGATGFVGNAVLCQLSLSSVGSLVAGLRKQTHGLPQGVEPIVVGDLLAGTDYSPVFKHDVDVLVHCAARVHIMDDHTTDPLAEFRKVNVAGTLNLAKQAAKAGVKRFVFISSIKVNGEATDGVPFTADDKAMMSDPYGVSKYEAEQGLLKVSQETGMEVVIIRPPLIYGPSVKANFQKMMQWMKQGVPLPLGAVYNKRSLVALDNLVDFIVLCTHHPKAANEIFLISDGEDVSTTELLRKVAKAMGKKAHLLPVPVGLMMFVAKLVGKEDVANRLFGSLQVDSSKARKLLGWKPVIGMDEQLRKTVKGCSILDG